MQTISLPQQATILCKAFWNGLSDNPDLRTQICIRDGLIADEGQSDETAVCLDYSENFVMPALIDTHIHLMMPYEQTKDIAARSMQYLSAGIFAARDGGNKDGFFAPCPPFICLQPGRAIFMRDSYGSSLGQPVSCMTDAMQMIDELAASGAAHIKVIASGIFSFTHFGHTGAATFTAAELREITKRAHTYGLSVMAHASGDEAVRRCLQANVTTIEHGYFMSKESLQELAFSGTFWIPTLSPVSAQLAEPPLAAALTPQMREVIARSLNVHEELVGHGGVLGARIGAGTDAGAPGVEHGAGLIREIYLLQKAGLSVHSALQAATSTAAAACCLKQTGRIEAGMLPNLLVVEKNPLHHPATLQKPLALLLAASTLA